MEETSVMSKLEAREQFENQLRYAFVKYEYEEEGDSLELILWQTNESARSESWYLMVQAGDEDCSAYLYVIKSVMRRFVELRIYPNNSRSLSGNERGMV
ncbi:jg10260 [Pararge aegeria aegeria]|uniref:Jg10260 protein n=1 Tax=Pararge aegeria aegeria TaxID=348720 RepID=A0A8S4S7P0_9NEOP|nr:jg10260 [Pararge aegeria aegeria]